MYRTFDEEVFLAPESIISGVLAASAFDDEPELPDVAPLAQPWPAATANFGASTEYADVDADPNASASADPVPGEPTCSDASAVGVDAWSRRAFGANGFGG